MPNGIYRFENAVRHDMSVAKKQYKELHKRRRCDILNFTVFKIIIEIEPEIKKSLRSAYHK